MPVWLLGILYSCRLKQSGLPGNLLVSFSVGVTILYGGLVVYLVSRRDRE